MTAEIIPFGGDKEHANWTGEAKCLACGHVWVAVSAVGNVIVECPRCGTMKGIAKHFCQSKYDAFVCNCGNDVFEVNREGILCIHCGVRTSYFDLADA